MDIQKLKENAYILIPTGAVLISVFYLSSKRKLDGKKGFKKIPYPVNATNWPLFGHMMAFGDNTSKKITEWHKETGPIYNINIGSQKWIMVSDPLLAHDIFVKSGATISSRPYHRFLFETYAKNQKGLVFRHYGENQWKTNRRLAVELLSPKSIDKYNDLLHSEVDFLMDRFAQISESKKAINPYENLELYSLNVIMLLIMNTRFDSLNDPVYTMFHSFSTKIMEYVGPKGDIGSFLPFLAWTDYFTNIKKEMREFIHSYRDTTLKKLISKALESDSPSIVKNLYDVKEGNLDDDDILVIINDLMSAGSDTLATTMHWSFFILSQYPEVQEKLNQEIKEWKSKNPPGAVPVFQQDREDFPYSICVQKEIMRLHSTTNFGMPHMASEDTIVNDYFIPKNAVIFSSMQAMHMSPEVYKDPEVFNPERFSNRTEKMSASANFKIEERDNYVFGWGRRICPGIYLAEIELFNFYTKFYEKFTVEIEGNPKNIDINDYVERGVMAEPIAHKYRISTRL